MKEVIIIGAGLAGCEAAYQLAKRNIKVKLYEQKPHKKHEAFKTDNYAELICSNSLRSNDIYTPCCNFIKFAFHGSRIFYIDYFREIFS